MRKTRIIGALAFLVFAGFPQLGLAASLDGGDAAPDTGDTAFMIVASALVLLMTPGLAFFYGGLVRRKNILSVLMQCFMCMCLMTVLWVIIGYSLAFGSNVAGGWIGSPSEYLFLKDVNGLSGTIPHLLFVAFQGMFAIITPALILGAFAERLKFGGFCLFMG
ncbi:MAG: ammonium transporter, partial [Lentisphaeria bacterium]